MAVSLSRSLGFVALAALLTACNDGEVILQGERLTPREAEAALAEGAAPLDAAGPKAVAIALPGQSGGDWTHVGGNAAHLAPDAAYSGALTRVWAANVGRGDSRRNRIGADPVIAGGRVFTLDANAVLTATGSNGATLWRTDLTPAADKSGDASGEGLAAGEGLVFAATGFGDLVALDPSTGAVRWRQRFDTPVAGSPAVAGGRVFVVTRDGAAWAVGAKDGKIAWQIPGTNPRAGVVGGSAPAVSGDKVVFPYGTGALVAADVAEGTEVWAGSAAGLRLGRAYAFVNDLTGEPVIAGNTLYVGSAAGRVVAIDMETGSTLWSADDGAGNAVVLAGGSLFFVNDEDQLMRIDAGTGEEIWRTDMPYFTKDKDKKRNRIYVHYGPVLAGGRIITASSDGQLRAFDPASGKLVGSAEIPGGAAAAPAVAGGTLYVLSRNGQLIAFR